MIQTKALLREGFFSYLPPYFIKLLSKLFYLLIINVILTYI